MRRPRVTAAVLGMPSACYFVFSSGGPLEEPFFFKSVILLDSRARYVKKKIETLEKRTTFFA